MTDAAVTVPPVFTVGAWTVRIFKNPILNSENIDQWSEELKMCLPEMTFGNNSVEIENLEHGVKFVFNTKNSLLSVGKEATAQVHCSTHWKENSKSAAEMSVKLDPYDWTFWTNHCGQILRINRHGEHVHNIEEIPCNEKINFERLKPNEKVAMIHFDEIPLFEDELHDNGTSALSLRLRITKEYAYVLLRQYLRVDKVLFRSFEVRRSIFFSEDFSLCQKTVREMKWDDAIMKLKIAKPEHRVEDLIIDADEVIPLLTIRHDATDKVIYNSSQE